LGLGLGLVQREPLLYLFGRSIIFSLFVSLPLPCFDFILLMWMDG
jgi:hypothetical protein